MGTHLLVGEVSMRMSVRWAVGKGVGIWRRQRQRHISIWTQGSPCQIQWRSASAYGERGYHHPS